LLEQRISTRVLRASLEIADSLFKIMATTNGFSVAVARCGESELRNLAVKSFPSCNVALRRNLDLWAQKLAELATR